MKAKLKALQKLDQEELSILQALEFGGLKPVKDLKKQMQMQRVAAQANLKKIRNKSKGT